MPSQQALESLRILSGGPSFRRQRPTTDFGFSGAVPTQGELESPFELEQTDRANAADVRDRAATDRIQSTNAALTEYNRPDVAAVREDQERTALSRLLLPIQMRGQFEVEAAKQAQLAQSQRDERLFGLRGNVQGQKDDAIAARAAANNKALALRQRLQALQTGKAHATPPGGLAGFIPGAQNRADQAEIKALLDQLATPTPDEAPDAVIPPVDAGAAGETAAQQLARLRATRGR